MKDVYILKKDLNSWISKYFKEDIISIYDLIGCIEDLDCEVDYLKEEKDNLTNQNDEPDYEEF